MHRNRTSGHDRTDDRDRTDARRSLTTEAASPLSDRTLVRDRRVVTDRTGGWAALDPIDRRAVVHPEGCLPLDDRNDPTIAGLAVITAITERTACRPATIAASSDEIRSRRSEMEPGYPERPVNTSRGASAHPDRRQHDATTRAGTAA